VDCDFCAEFAGDPMGGRIIVREGDWVLLPTVGCFIPGYCLLMPIRHVEAIAELPRAELNWMDAFLTRMRRLIEDRFGPAIVAEHGPGRCDVGASCCSHAHLHLIPMGSHVASVIAAYERTGGPPTILPDLSALSNRAGEPYLYLSPGTQMHLVWHAAGFPRQFVRRVCASALGIGAQYDWRDHPFLPQMRQTLASLQSAVGTTARDWVAS
jgi:diadenosine tetraphosphate (Ap4A) HIT family hydrolase